MRYALIDVTAEDRSGRPVAGLTRDDFELLVDYRPVPVETLDVRCEPGVEGEPGADAVPDAAPSRVLLVFDYFHIADPVFALRGMRDELATTDLGGIEHAVVALGETLRLESPFTTDPARLVEAVDRMIADPSLYDGAYGRLTEFRFFERLESLFDLMEPIEGRKLLVLVSGPLRKDGWDHDTAHRRIAALAGETRTAIHAVDSRGMRAPKGFRYGDLGGPPGLVRLASATGGRETHHTNDLGLAYRRARRDLACTYTLGFRDERPRLDQPRRIRVFARRGEGIRVRHVDAWVARSDASRMEGLARSAAMVPELFPADGLAATWRLLPEERSSRRRPVEMELRWDPRRLPPIEAGSGLRLDGALHNERGTRLRSFERSPAAGDDDARIALGPYPLRPGRYLASFVLSSPSWDRPRALRLAIDVPGPATTASGP